MFSVNGNWGSWTFTTECGVQCGGGMRMKTRYCNSPSAANGGLQCQHSIQQDDGSFRGGEESTSVRCNTDPCPGEITFISLEHDLLVCHGTSHDEYVSTRLQNLT